MSNNRINDSSQTNGKNFGEPFTYDPTFNGPLKNRSCTDVIILLLFIAFIIGWIIIAILGFIHGNPQKIIFPTDSYGGICGRGKHENEPYLYFFNLLKCAENLKNGRIFDRCDTPQVCVEKCPNQTFSLFPPKTIHEKDLDFMICKYGIKKNVNNAQDLIKKNDCAGLYLKSEPLGGRCIPSFLTMIGNNFIDEMNGGTITDENGTVINHDKIKQTNKAIALLLNAREIGSKIIQDLSHTWQWILVGLTIAMIISFAWIVCMQWFAYIMVWFSIIALTVFNGIGLYYCLTRYYKLKDLDSSNSTEVKGKSLTEEEYNFRESMKSQLDSYLANQTTWLVFSIICGLVLIILILVLLYLRKRITLAIALIVEASKAVSCVKSSLFFPIIPYILQFIVICFWGAVAIMITASARPQYLDAKGNECEPNMTVSTEIISTTISPNISDECVFTKYFEEKLIFQAQIYNLFGLLWGLFFIVGVGHVSLAGAFASYYWVLDKPGGVQYFAVLGGFYRCIRYHVGSVALGSLLIATIRFIRIALEYIDRKCRKYADNFIAKAILCCCKCFFWCLEAFMRFINKNAYIMIAIYGKNFCSSASTGFFLILRNAARAVVLDKVTDFLLIIGKLAVTSIVAVLSFYVFSHRVTFVDVPDLNYYWVPIVVISFGTYLISSCFFSVYHMAVDTLFLCFLEDCERNDGSKEKPFYMSKQLMKVLGKKKNT